MKKFEAPLMADEKANIDIGDDGDGDGDEKWAHHYSSNHQILLVGEGDFSFSLSLAKSFGSASNISASSLDSYDVVVRNYKNARSNLETLKELGASLLHGVDATDMHLHPDLKMRRFDRIVFNFPHAGFHGKENDADLIRKHRRLVGGFFHCANRLLRANGEVHVSHKNNPPFCDWNIEELASRSYLAMTERVDFKKEYYPGYENKRGASSRCDEPFILGDCSTFMFRFSRVAKEIYAEKTKSRNFVSQKYKHSQAVVPPVTSEPPLSFGPGYDRRDVLDQICQRPVPFDLCSNLNDYNWMQFQDVPHGVRQRPFFDLRFHQKNNHMQFHDAFAQARQRSVSWDLSNHRYDYSFELRHTQRLVSLYAMAQTRQSPVFSGRCNYHQNDNFLELRRRQSPVLSDRSNYHQYDNLFELRRRQSLGLSDLSNYQYDNLLEPQDRQRQVSLERACFKFHDNQIQAYEASHAVRNRLLPLARDFPVQPSRQEEKFFDQSYIQMCNGEVPRPYAAESHERSLYGHRELHIWHPKYRYDLERDDVEHHRSMIEARFAPLGGLYY